VLSAHRASAAAAPLDAHLPGMWGDLDLARRWPRLLSLALGLWLVAESLVAPGDPTAGFDRLVVGLGVVACAGMALWAPWFRFGSTALGLWLLFAELLFEHGSRTLHGLTLAAGAAIVVLSLVPSPPRLVDPRRPSEA
jgi:hypothetical protein